MSRFGGVFWFILVIASGMTNFLVKQNVQGLEDQLNAVRKKTVAEQKAIHELQADWTFLNQPELLADLNNRYVHLIAVSPKQVLTNPDSLPMRPAPPEVSMQPVAALDTPAETPLDPAPPPLTIATATAVALMPPPVAAPTPPALPVRPQAIPTAGAAPAPVPTRPTVSLTSLITTAAIAAPVHTPPAKPASLDGLFAQISGGR